MSFLLAGKTNVMTALRGNELVAVPIDEVISNTNKLSEKFIEMTHILAK